MKGDKNFFIIDKNVLPEIFIKVMEVKNILETGKEKTVQEAVNSVGISRSAFYKYKDAVYPFYENTRGRTVTIGLNLDDKKGILSALINTVSDSGANILTINQTIPINGVANVTITIETNDLRCDLKTFVKKIEALEGLRSFKIIARE